VIFARDKHTFLLQYLLFLLNNFIFSFCIISLVQMAIYTEDDIQNALADVGNGVTLATAATKYGVLRNTLRERLEGVQSCRHAHEEEQRLSTVQEQNLERWILRQETLGYAPTHTQVQTIANDILHQEDDDKPLEKK
jgi:hypothetical protein